MSVNRATPTTEPKKPGPLTDGIERAIGKIEKSLAHQAVLREKGHQYGIKNQGESK